MYSNHLNVNILTSLLVQWGVKYAVVCPGSRNAPIVHNLNECPEITCFAVTDERSAGFFALGQSQVEDEPVVVCVTSGSALLNVAPAVAEAMYQHRRLIIISADRPAAMIDQLQGQTLPQPHALGTLVRKAVNLPDPHDDTERWYCNRLVNEALVEMGRGEGGPVHINVPIAEPLFGFDTPELPAERKITLHQAESDYLALTEIATEFKKARRPMVLIGQTKPENLATIEEDLATLEDYAVVLDEKLGNDTMTVPHHVDEMMARIQGEEDEYLPDFIVYCGDTFVSKRLRQFLSKAADARTVVVNRDGAVRDVTMHLTDVVQAPIDDMINILAMTVDGRKPTAYRRLWQKLEMQCFQHAEEYVPRYSQMAAVRALFQATVDIDCEYQLANSMAVRLGLIYSDQYVFVNRGVNGIEGCLSTATGFACAVNALTFCVIGDLAFYYDQNALWNNNLTSNLRILLLNNGGGGIFRSLPGLQQSAAAHPLVSGAHQTTAEGICFENNVVYLQAHNMEELAEGLETLTDMKLIQPVLLEVFTNPEEDEQVMHDYIFGEKRQLN